MSQAPVRLAVANDLPGLLDLYRHLNSDDAVLSPEAAQPIWDDLLSLTHTKVLVIDGPSDPVCTCTVTIIPSLTRGGRSYAVIENVVTHPDARRTGLGAAIVAAAVEAAWAANCYKVSLATGSQRESTLRFYETAGFERNGRTFFEMRRL